MSESLALPPTVSTNARRTTTTARRPHAAARNFRFPSTRNAKGPKLGESAEDKAMIEAFIREKGISVQKPGHAFGSMSMPTFEQFAAPSY
jgi:hypothetical protein